MRRPVGSRTRFESSKFTVQSWRFEDPRLGVYERDIVVHPGAVLIIPVLPGDRLVMIHNERDAVGVELLEFPAGTRRAGEPASACAGRELEEETGYRAAMLEPLCEFFTCPGFCTERMHVFVARQLTRTAAQREHLERIRNAVVGLREALHMIAAGRLVDGKSIAALSVYHMRASEDL